MSDNITNKPIADALNVGAPDGGVAVSEEVSTMHEVLSQALGKDFKDDESAMKAVKDTFAYVGKVGKFAPKLEALQQALGSESKLLEFMDNSLNKQTETSAPAVDTSQFVTKDDLARDSFYRDNPEYKPYQATIDAISKAEGKAPSEIVVSDTFKPLFEKVKAADAITSEKSVLHSNPRLGAVTDNMAKVQEAMKGGDTAAAGQAAYEAISAAYPELESRR